MFYCRLIDFFVFNILFEDLNVPRQVKKYIYRTNDRSNYLPN